MSRSRYDTNPVRMLKAMLVGAEHCQHGLSEKHGTCIKIVLCLARDCWQGQGQYLALAMGHAQSAVCPGILLCACLRSHLFGAACNMLHPHFNSQAVCLRLRAT